MTSSNTTENKIQKFITDKYTKTNYAGSLTSSQDTKLPIKIVLHSLEGEQVEFSFKNLFAQEADYQHLSRDSLKFPVDNISLFSVYEESGAERINIYNSFFNLLEKYYNQGVTGATTSSQKSINSLLNSGKGNTTNITKNKCGIVENATKPPREKALSRDLLVKQLSCEYVKNNEYTLIDDIYEFAKTFYTLGINQENHDIFTKIYGYTYISYALREPKYNPEELRKFTEKKIYEQVKKYLFKPDYSDPDSDDYKKAVTVNNILKIMQRVLPKNRELYFKNARDGTQNTYIVSSDVTLNETYRDLQRITGSTLEIHLDVKLISFVKSESIKFTINFKGDLNRKRVEYKPGEMMLNPYSSFTEIFFTNKYRITEQILNRDVFKSLYGDKMDKRLFFLDKTIHKALLDYLKNEELEKRRREGKSYKGDDGLSDRQRADQHKANVDLVIKYFFEQSTDEKYPRKGAIVVDKKNYYIQRISNRDYFFGNEPRTYETMQIPVQEATIDLDYETFRKFYNDNKKNSLKVYVDKSPEELIRLDLDYQNRPDVQDLPPSKLNEIKEEHSTLVEALKEKHIKPRFQQVFTTFSNQRSNVGMKEFDMTNLETSTVNLTADLNNGDYTAQFKNIPYSAVKIIVDRENIEAILKIDLTFSHIYRDNKRFEFIDGYNASGKDANRDKFLSSIDAGVILVKDKGAQQLKSIASGESEKTVYGVELDLTVLDRGAGDITFARELLSGSCIDNSSRLDKTIYQVFKPIFEQDTFQFFQDIIESKGRQQTEKYRDYVEEKYADQIRLKPKDGKDGKDKKDGKDGKDKKDEKDEKNQSATSVKKGGSKNRNSKTKTKTKKRIKRKKYLNRKRRHFKLNNTIKRNRLFKRKRQTYKKTYKKH